MSDANSYNMPSLMREMADDGDMQIAVATVAKCTNSCLISLKENTLLPTEETCMMNCYNKAWDFSANYSDRFAYATRQMKH